MRDLRNKLEAIVAEILVNYGDSDTFSRNDWYDIIVSADIGFDKRTVENWLRVAKIKHVIKDTGKGRFTRGLAFNTFIRKQESTQETQQQ